MKARTIVCILALAAVPAAAHAQMGGGGMGGGGGGRPRGGGGGEGRGRHGGPEGMPSHRSPVPDTRNPLRVILDDSAGLALTADQAARVRVLSDSLDRENRPLVEQVRRTLGGDTPILMDDSTYEQRMGVLKTYFERIRWNNGETWKQARTLLTRDQAKRADDARHAAERARAGRRPLGPRPDGTGSPISLPGQEPPYVE
ncbi:MAG: hypothetical protein JWM27_4457 [Gemmatimonadetes bacterium]|nr:hypothetical protein [Gemmatimonadota bacterium]